MKKKKGEVSSWYLPEEIITHILTKVPAKYLIGFKTVCKRWKALFSRQYFVDSHVRHSRSSQQQIFFTTYEAEEDKLSYINLENMRIENLVLNIPFGCKYSLKASCHGLLLVLDEHCNVHLYNPVTVKDFRLPDLRDNDLEDNFGEDLAEDIMDADIDGWYWSLIFDDNIGKYKVFGFDGDHDHLYCLVLTVGENCWKHWIYPSHIEPTSYSSLVFLDNELHWLKWQGTDGYSSSSYSDESSSSDKDENISTLKNDGESESESENDTFSEKWLVVSMDVGTMKYRETKVPNTKGRTALLCEVKGSLCLVDIGLRTLNIFVLKKGAPLTWIKQYRTMFQWMHCCSKLHLVAMREEDGWDLSKLMIFTVYDGQLICYNMTSHEWRKIGPISRSNLLGYCSFSGTIVGV